MSLEIETVEMHTGGEPVRLVTAGYPAIPGATILAKRRHAREHLDHLRRLLMFEPRGHFDMYGVLPVEPDLPGADLAVLFIHNEGYSTMCGHAVIALGRWAVDRGIVPRQAGETRVAIQCPCGLVEAFVAADGAVALQKRAGLRLRPRRPGGGAGAGHDHARYRLWRRLLRAGAGGALRPRRAALDDAGSGRCRPCRHGGGQGARSRSTHPDDPDLAFLYGTILTDGADAFSPEATANICVFAAREVDRSPTGSGVTARIAVQHARGLIALGQERRFESVTGAIFTGKALRDDARRKLRGGDRRGRRQGPLHRPRALHPGGGGRDREGVSAALRLSPRPVPKSLGSPLVMVGEGRPSTSLSALRLPMPARLSVSAIARVLTARARS